MYKLRFSRAAVSKVQVIILLLVISVPPMVVTFFYVNGFFTSTLPQFSDNFDYGNMTTLNSIWAWTNSADVYPVTCVPTLSGSGFIGEKGGTCSLDSSTYYSVGYSAKFVLPSNIGSWALLYKDTPNKQFYDTLYMSNQIYVTNMPPVGQYLMVGSTLCGWHDYDFVSAYIYNDGGTLKWTMLYTDVVNTKQPNYYGSFVLSNVSPVADTWYDVQVMVHLSSVGQGEASMWVNGVKTSTVTGLTNNHDLGPNGELGVRFLQVGPFDASWNTQGFETTVYADDVRVSASYIN